MTVSASARSRARMPAAAGILEAVTLPTFPATHLRRFMLCAGFAGKTLKLRSVRPAGNLSPPFPLCGQQQRLLFFVSVFDRFSVFQYMHTRGKHFVHYTRIRYDLYSENLS